MKKFSDFANSYEKNNSKDNNFSNNEGFEMLKDLASRYEGASENQLISAILKEADRARREGRLNDVEIDNFVNMISPVLNESQKKQLSKVVKQLKNKK